MTPHIIRTAEELESLDPDTWLLSTPFDGLAQSDWIHDHGVLGDVIFPLVVIATGEQVRAARQVLEQEQGNV